MRHLTGLFSVRALLFLPGVSLAAGPQRFDGMWQTTVSCATAWDALGYFFRCISTVKDGRPPRRLRYRGSTKFSANRRDDR